MVDLSTIFELWPEVVLICSATCIFVAGTWTRARTWWAVFSLLAYATAAACDGFVGSGGLRSALGGSVMAHINGPLRNDVLGHGCRWLALLVGSLLTFVAMHRPQPRVASEYFGALMLVTAGMMLVARANDLVLLFVALELVSVPLYVLLFLGRRDRVTAEASAKYFFLSLLASALLLYGLSFLYGTAGTTTIAGTATEPGIRELWAAGTVRGFASLVPIALVLIWGGLGFKIAAVPFHFYAPDVYQGTTTANAALLASAPKVAGIVALVRLLVPTFAGSELCWQLALVLAIATLTVGNVCALWQTNLRRLLAYSCIAHSGYLLIGFTVAIAAGSAAEFGGVAALAFYLVAYVLGSVGAFAAISYVRGTRGELNDLSELAGLARSQPMVAAGLAVCMCSLAGLPPLAGFWGKLTLFTGAVDVALASEGRQQALFILLAVAGALNAVIGAAYYLRVVGVMFFREPATQHETNGAVGTAIGLGICSLLLVVVGIRPGGLLDATKVAEQELQRRERLSAVKVEVPVFRLSQKWMD